MPEIKKIKTGSSSYKTIVSAVSKLSIEEKQMLRLQLFSADALNEMKKFEARLKEKKPLVKTTDEEIVNIITSIRRKKYADTKKMLH